MKIADTVNANARNAATTEQKQKSIAQRAQFINKNSIMGIVNNDI